MRSPDRQQLSVVESKCQGYETVSPGKVPQMTDDNTESPIDLSLTRLANDPLARILLENSHLSKVQFQTFLIDILWATSQESRRDLKSRLKPQRRRVSKGAFNRSLSQARRNVVESIYTVFLLAYFGLFDSPKLEPFLRLGNEMQTFLDAKLETSQTQDSEARIATKILEDALEEAIGELARMSGFKKHRDVT
jgi:hypothetical protein